MILPRAYLEFNMGDSHICDLTRFEGPKCVSILPPYSNRVKSLLCAFNDYVSILVCSTENKNPQNSQQTFSAEDILERSKIG